MKQDNDKFNQIIKEKLEDFEVPFNESHWSEMSESLDSMEGVSKGNSGFGNKYMWIAAAGIVAVASWFYLTKEDESIPQSSFKPTPVLKEKTNANEVTTIEPGNGNEKIPSENQQVVESPQDIQETAEQEQPIPKVADDKLDKYADFSQQQVNEEGITELEQIIDEHKSTFEDEPKIDNVELKTSIVVNEKVICSGEEVQFSVDRDIDNANYYWDFGDGDLKSRKKNPKHTFKRSGTFTVRLNVSKGDIGSKNDWPTEMEVTVLRSPEVEIISENNQITLNEPYAWFETSSNEPCKYAWTFNENQKARGERVSFLVPEQSSYSVRVEAKNEAGCNTIDEYTYNASKGVKMFVENAFTPNGDGLRDEFLPQELSISEVPFTFIVMDRNGRVVYQTDNKYAPWNGKLNNSGSDMPTGVYPWKVVFTDDRGKKHEQSGSITITR